MAPDSKVSLDTIVQSLLTAGARTVCAMNRRTENVRSTERKRRFFARESLLQPGEEPPVASHLVTPRALYCHHGIYAGNGRVIHYAGLAHGLRRGPVEDVSLQEFARGRCVRVRHDAARFDRGEVLERARSRLGECRYRVLTNNCEHFCAWALQGKSAMKSHQVTAMMIVALLISVASIALEAQDRSTLQTPNGVRRTDLQYIVEEGKPLVVMAE